MRLIEGLENKLKSLLPKLAQAAQKVYDAWEQDEEGIDPTYGTGGICDDIAEAQYWVLADNDLGGFTLYNEYDYHTSAYAIDYHEKEIFMINLPAYVYEEGAGYTWKKIPNVRIRPSDISIEDQSLYWDDMIDEEGNVREQY